MKKILVLFAFALSLFGLTACSEGDVPTLTEASKGFQYSKGILSEVAPLTTAYAGLHNLYLNPLSYMSGNWKSDFDKYDDTIESSYEKIKGLQPPKDFKKAHNQFLSTLEKTIAVNDATEDTIKAGGEITTDMTKQFESAYKSFQSFAEKSEELKK